MARKPAGAGAVMADRAPKEVEEDSPQVRLWRSLDFFPTPPWGTRAGAEVLQTLDPACRYVTEPCCGEMHMAGPLSAYFDVSPSDVYPHLPNTPLRDWLDDSLWGQDEFDWVVTNPPFSLAHEFVNRGLARARRGVALLLRLSFLEGQERYHLLAGDNPLTLLATFSERLPMTLGRWDLSKGTATGYGWFFWMKGAAPLPPMWLSPGTRDRLWLPTDAERYGWREPLPLFEGL